MSVIKTIVVLAVIYAVFLFSGYGVTVGSSENAAGLGLKCQYLTARGIVDSQYIHSDSGIVGVANCPIFKKIGDVVDKS
ncbi:hypothetical protein BS639_14695 [Rouxiella silvae]|uniref:Uncharacterized protein YobH n=1 Tax=Rouxiella silvae TaxID=1646373 RepID=A0AA40X0I3_9GAMM|nr:YobH family protein [Rouxiella silvae]KQN46857.1 hypothetical protein ASE93_12145 [Serratia sp. Leaf50]MBF6636513.1 hypothetical protein [Rouxiella silvae]ORJ20444.1 hypothetical protein BS639_14695 [Rouxiella silvae]